MLFLIQYDRRAGKIVEFKQFNDDQHEQAYRVRLDLEMELVRRHVRDEVVILEAATEVALRKTHRRYFEDLKELATPSRAANSI